MKLHIIGSGHGKPQKNRKYTSLLLEVNDAYYVIDAGSCVEEYMISKGLPVEKIKGIFITHSHMDHVGSLPLLVKYLISRENKSAVYLPDEVIMDVFKQFLMVTHERVNEEFYSKRISINKSFEGLFYEDENVKVYGIKTEHMEKNDSYAYLFEAVGKRLLFTGDMSADIHDYPKVLFEKEFDVVICEFTHMYWSLEHNAEVMRKLVDTRTKKFIFNHIHPYCEQLLEKGHLDYLKHKAVFATDGEEFNI